MKRLLLALLFLTLNVQGETLSASVGLWSESPSTYSSASSKASVWEDDRQAAYLQYLFQINYNKDFGTVFFQTQRKGDSTIVTPFNSFDIKSYALGYLYEFNTMPVFVGASIKTNQRLAQNQTHSLVDRFYSTAITTGYNYAYSDSIELQFYLQQEDVLRDVQYGIKLTFK